MFGLWRTRDFFRAVFPLPLQTGQYARIPAEDVRSVATNGYDLKYCAKRRGGGAAAAEGDNDEPWVVDEADPAPVGIYNAKDVHAGI